MKIAITYVYPAHLEARYIEYAIRFMKSYNEFLPGAEHQSVVVINGAPATMEHRCFFSCLPNLTLISHDNSGYDIGAYQIASKRVACDLMVFFGASTYFKRAGWLKRMADSAQAQGQTLYGAMGNAGDRRFNVYPHIRTTAFWISPQLFNRYPTTVTRPEQRFPFEHGRSCLTSWVKSLGKKVWVVGWNGMLQVELCNSMINGFHRGDQSGLLAGDHLSEPPFYATP